MYGGALYQLTCLVAGMAGRGRGGRRGGAGQEGQGEAGRGGAGQAARAEQGSARARAGEGRATKGRAGARQGTSGQGRADGAGSGKGRAWRARAGRAGLKAERSSDLLAKPACELHHSHTMLLMHKSCQQNLSQHQRKQVVAPDLHTSRLWHTAAYLDRNSRRRPSSMSIGTAKWRWDWRHASSG